MYKYIHCSIFYDSKKAESNLMISFLGDWLDYLWYVHTVEYYAAIKKDKVKLHI